MTRSIVFIWDNFGPTHVDRAEAVAAWAVAAGADPLTVVGIELRRKSADYDWVSESGTGFRKVNLTREDGAWPLMAFRIVRAVMRVQPAVIFSCHYERPEILAAVVVMRLFGVPVFAMFDSKFDDYQRFLWREVLKRLFFLPYSGAIVGSRRAASYLRFLGFQPDRLLPGYDAISIERIRRLSETSPAPGGLSFVERHFTIVARLVPKKNITTAIRAFAILRRDGSNRRLVICGSGPLASELRAEVAALGIDDAVGFEGFVQTAEVARTLGSTLALIQPSVEEQFGIVIAEAVAMGVPVIVSENCGARDTLVRTEINGFVFEPDNVDGLAALMKRIDDDPALWCEMAAASIAISQLADTPVFVDSVRRLGGMSVYRTPEQLAPIAVFAYRRAAHLENCLNALEKCPEFAASQVFVFVDGPRNEAEAEAVGAVRALLESRLRPNMTIVAREANLGLASSIIAEVTDLVKRYGRIIVIEDDQVVEPTALGWLNQALEAYEDDPRVMQVSAYQYRTPEFDNRLTGTFQRFTTTWGWATWKRAWDKFDPRAEGWQRILAPGPERNAFDAGGVYPFSDILIKQMSGELDSWGIRWSWSVHKAGGLTLMPPRSLLSNDGYVVGATHNSIGWLKLFVSGPKPQLWRKKEPPSFPGTTTVVPNEEAAFRRGLQRTQAMRNARVKAILAFLNLHISSTKIHRRVRRVIAVAQLPPPISGLSIVSKRMITEFEKASLLFSSGNIAPALGLAGFAKAVDRLARTLMAGINLWRPMYRRSTTLYTACDGGLGQIYNLILVLFAMPGRYEIWLHHHSFAYINRRSYLTALLVRMCPTGTHHIFLCKEMADQFCAAYRKEWDGGQHQVNIISNAFTVDPPPQNHRAAGPLTIGHLSNLTTDKGSVRFINLFRRLVDAGISVRGELAGPIQDRATAEAVRATEAAYPSNFKWRGPLSGSAKDAFYDAIDVFVFPTQYVNEAQPLVLIEALAHGAAVIACTRGCIACDHEKTPGLIVESIEFEDAAFDWLSTLTDASRRDLPNAARAAFIAMRNIADKQLAEVFSKMENGPNIIP